MDITATGRRPIEEEAEDGEADGRDGVSERDRRFARISKHAYYGFVQVGAYGIYTWVFGSRMLVAPSHCSHIVAASLVTWAAGETCGPVEGGVMNPAARRAGRAGGGRGHETRAQALAGLVEGGGMDPRRRRRPVPLTAR